MDTSGDEKMKIILDNIIFRLQSLGGISVVWRELIRRAAADPDLDVTIWDDGAERKVRCLERYRNPDCQLTEPAIFHSSYLRVLPLPGVKNITTIHDLTYHHAFAGPAKWIHVAQERHALRHSDQVICVSQATKRDLLRYYPWLDKSRVHVVYNGVSEVFRPMAHVEKKNYLLYVGNTRPAYKNYAMAQAVADRVGLPLVVPQEVSEEQLCRHYNEALCLIYSSEHEGFGLPIVEAQAAGCPVIAQRTSCIPEIGGEAVLYVEHGAREQVIEDMVVRVRDLLSGREDRQKWVERGWKNADRFSWDKTYEQIKAIYKEC